MSILVRAKGITKLSQLQIDGDKDWNGKGITNIKHIAEGMTKGHIMQHNGQVLETLPAEVAANVLTSAGPGQKVVWAPGGTYLNRYFPVSIHLTQDARKPFSTDRNKSILAPLTVPYSIEDHLNAGWVERLEPEIEASLLLDTFSPNKANTISPARVDTSIQADIPVNGAVTEAGGIPIDETTQAKSGLSIDQSYTANDDNSQSLGNTSTWESQTFTTGLAQRVRGVWLKLYKQQISATPGIVTCSIKAVDGSNHPTGVDLCIGTIDGNAVPYYSDTTADWVWIPFTTGMWLNNATRYAIILRTAAAGLNWRCDVTSPIYAGGNREYSTNAGTSWTTDAAKDFLFKVAYTLDDMNLLPAGSPNIGDTYYWGFERVFPRILQDIGRVGAGTYTLVWEYSRGGGSWASCLDLVDGTNNFQNFGMNVISHSPQADWATDAVGGIPDKYWLRARCANAGAGYTQPKGTYARISLDL
jgi:hypothetical protein